MSKSGVFAHFSSKETMQIEVLRGARDLADAAVFGGDSSVGGVARLGVFFRRWTGWASRSGLPGGCPFVAAVFEFDDLDGPVRDALMAIQAEFFGRMAALVEGAVVAGDLQADTDVGQFVWEMVAIYNGHHVSQRFLRDPAADTRAGVAFDGLVRRYTNTSETLRSRRNRRREPGADPLSAV